MIGSRLAAAIEREPGAAAGSALIARWLGRGADPAVLLDAARGSGGEPWELRRIATLMLEYEALRGDDAQLASLCERLGMAGDAVQLRARLARNARVHDGIRGRRTSPRALEAFFRLARAECRLAFARYVFRAEEVCARIERLVRMAPAVRDGLSDAPPPYATEEAPHTLEALPELERTILQTLADPPRTFWVGDDTPSDINSLIEYPRGTVALTIKPPGSTHEIEIKRCGQRGPAVLGAACKAGQWTRAHYMRGASSKPMLIWEASASAFVCRAWRLVHGVEAPVSRTLFLNNVTSVPSENGPVNILRYFVDPSLHNGDFEELRRAIHDAVHEELHREGNVRRAPDDDGPLTGVFVGMIHPGQAVMTGTSSFRLDLLARGGAIEDAGALLDEILGEWTPPKTRARTYRAYAAAALAANRQRADACYVDVLQQIGRFWGTLCALRIGTNGESFVPRNVGLRSVWEDGRWRVRVIFMDHDGMIVPGLQTRDFLPGTLIRPMMNDYRHIFGGRIRGAVIAGELAAVQHIYQPRPSLARLARRIVQLAARAAYDTTISAIATNLDLRALYGDRYVARLHDWDNAVSCYLGDRDAWELPTRERLGQAGYGQQGIESYVSALREFGVLVRKTAFLYREAND